MTLEQINDFAEEHGCGDFTFIVADVAGKELWLGKPRVEAESLVLIAESKNSYFNLNQLLFWRKVMLYPNNPVIIKSDNVDYQVKSLGRGATPDGGAKAIILQV